MDFLMVRLKFSEAFVDRCSIRYKNKKDRIKMTVSISRIQNAIQAIGAAAAAAAGRPADLEGDW
jgi:hypothetical protein